MAMGESCVFDFDSPVPIEEIREGLQRLALQTELLTIEPEARRRSTGSQSKQYSLGVPVYLYMGTEVSFSADLVALGKYVLSIAEGDVYYFRDDLCEDYDDQNTREIAVEDLATLLPNGFPYIRYLVRRSVAVGPDNALEAPP